MNRQKRKGPSYNSKEKDGVKIANQDRPKKAINGADQNNGKSRLTAVQQTGLSLKKYLFAGNSLVLFLVLWVLLSWVYGDVMWRTEQNSYVSVSAMQMKHLTDVSMGWIFYAARWLLTLFKYPWIGGLLMALLLLASSEMLAYVLRVPIKWKWLTSLLPFAYFGWLLMRGFNLYYRSEPSMVVLLPTACCGLLCVVSIFVCLLKKGTKFSISSRNRIAFAIGFFVLIASGIMAILTLPIIAALWLIVFFAIYVYAAVFCICRKSFVREEFSSVSSRSLLVSMSVMIILGIALGTTAIKVNDSVIATARMQRLMEEQNWEKMAEVALKLDRPTRSVAAYYAIALEQQDALLEGIFDLPFDFPKVSFDDDQPSDEYTLFTPDCNLAAGLTNSAYHEAFEQTVMSGLRLHWLKTMAKAAVMNGEEKLARKYIAIIRANPFESDFCNRIEPMIDNPELIDQDAELSHVRQLAPRDKHPFEQQFRKPVFLGYNMGLSEGPDAVLRTSAAACLYSKDLNAFIPRAQVFVAKKWPLPECMQQALVIYSIKHGGADFLKQFQGAISPMVEQTIAAFSRDVAPIAKDKEAMRRELKADWLGSYVYYYYCENNNPEQVRKQESAGVN